MKFNKSTAKKSYTLEEAVSHLIDYRGKTPKKTDSGIPLVTAKIVKKGRLEPYNEFIAEDNYDSWMVRGIPKKGDIVLTVEAPLGEVAQLDDTKIALAQRIVTLRGKENILNNDYLLYLLQSREVQSQLEARSSGSTVKGIKQSELRKLTLDLPPLPTQKKIAHILSTLDDKIELNRKMNQTLEEMAQALFKSLFVDFDPVHAKAKCSSDEELETAAKELGISKEILELFPSEFEDSELGMIPKGWEIGHLGDKNFSMLIGSGINSFEGEKIYLATADVADTNITSQEILITYESRPSRANMQPVIGSVWFAKMQNSRKLLMFDNYSSTDSLILSTGFAGIKTTELSHCFIWSFIMSDAFNISKDNLADGAVQIAINNTSIKKINYTQPSDDILKLFTEKTSNLFRCKYQNDLEIQTLQKTRDTLLPKLLSGELDVSELDLDVE